MDRDVEDVNEMVAHLATRHIKVPRDWLVALRDWVVENEPEYRDNMAEAAYLHLLQTDLNVLKCGCLPPDVSNADSVKRIITGHFFLQVNSVMDIGHSAYGQLNKLQGVDDSNIEATSKDYKDEVQIDGRTLSLELTDGVQNVSGMEWQPVPCLSVSMSPGSKILLHGQLECRRGVLLLSADNTLLLGGAVHELTEINGQMNLLKRQLEKLTPPGGRKPNVPPPVPMSPTPPGSRYRPGPTTSTYPRRTGTTNTGRARRRPTYARRTRPTYRRRAGSTVPRQTVPNVPRPTLPTVPRTTVSNVPRPAMPSTSAARFDFGSEMDDDAEDEQFWLDFCNDPSSH